MQILIIAGNVGRDAALRRTQSGDAVLSFSVAVDTGKDKSGNKRDALWVDCSVWGKRAESLERHVTKGLKLSLSGRPTVREHEGKAYLGMSVNDLTFMGGGQSDGGYSQRPPAEGNVDNGGLNPGARDFDDGVPF